MVDADIDANHGLLMTSRHHISPLHAFGHTMLMHPYPYKTPVIINSLTFHAIVVRTHYPNINSSVTPLPPLRHTSSCVHTTMSYLHVQLVRKPFPTRGDGSQRKHRRRGSVELQLWLHAGLGIWGPDKFRASSKRIQMCSFRGCARKWPVSRVKCALSSLFPLFASSKSLTTHACS